VLFQRPPRDPTWLDKLVVLSQINLQALKKARMSCGAAEWNIALQTGAAVKELLERYKAAGSPGLLARYTGDDDACVEPAIAVIDDEASVRKALERLLRTQGLYVCTYVSAEHFLQTIPPKRIGCLIIDVDLPGISGLELKRRLSQSEWRHVPVIFITGNLDPDRRTQAMQDGAHTFLFKPFSMEDLLEAVRSAMQTATATA
jgi:CheY-like chemotaxis protein